jgi:alkylation response protein AidB-like acyl-CoA dehydrogenase
MDLRLSELQELLRANAQEFFEREVTFERIREIEAADTPDAQLWDQMVQLGWTSLPIAEAYGGQGGTLLDTSILVNEACRAALPSPFTSTLIGAMAVQAHGSEDVKNAVLPRLADGVAISSAVLEADDAIYGDPQTTSDGSTVSGEKRFVEFGATSDLHLVTASRNGSQGIAVVARDQAGVKATPVRTIGALPQAHVSYDGAAVAGWIDGAEAVDALRDIGTALTAFEAYAYAQKALDLTVDYVQLRVQFGQPLGSFQAVQMRCADMATIVEGSRFLANELLWKLDQGEATRRDVAMVKAITSKMAPQVLQDCHLLHGGIGYMQEYDLHFFTRRGKEASLRWGSARETMNVVVDTAFA